MRSLLSALAPRAALAPVATPSPVPQSSAREAKMASAMLGGGKGGTTAALEAAERNPTLTGMAVRYSEAVADVEWHCYTRAASGRDEERTEVPDHPAKLLWETPNSFMDGMLLRETLAMQLFLARRAYLVLDRKGMAPPVSMFPVRPDRIAPVKDPRRFQVGWVYLDPEGGEVPLKLEEVIQLKAAHPTDPFGALTPVEALSTTIETAKLAGEWNRNFFLNSAEPGGIIEVPDGLDDVQWDSFVTRWNEQHRGVSRAHRVAVIEHGKWVERSTSHKDMEFSSLPGLTRDQVMEGYAFPRSMLGITDDVNRANAEAGEYVFSRWLVRPALARLRAAANTRLLPMFPGGENLEMDFDDPVPSNREVDIAERKAAVEGFVALVGAGVDPAAAAEAMDLPEMPMVEKATPESEAPPFGGAPRELPGGVVEGEVVEEGVTAWLPAFARPRAAAGEDEEPTILEIVEGVDLAPMAAAWEAATASLLAAWMSRIVPSWIGQLVEQVRAIMRGGFTPAEFYDLRVDTAEAVDLLTERMTAMAREGADAVVREAKAFDRDLTPYTPSRRELEDVAEGVARGLARDLELGAGNRAVQVATSGVSSADDVAEAVREHLEAKSDAEPARRTRGAMTGAQNAGRAQTLRRAPEGALYANEVLDRNTCGPCRRIHGRWIANTSDMETVWRLYPVATGYVDCEGGPNCRGTIVGVWRPEQTK